MEDPQLMPSRKSERKRIFLLAGIMAVVALSVGGLSLTVLYETAFEEARARLVETAQSRARLIEAIARFDIEHQHVHPHNELDATLTQLRDAHEKFQGFGETGEFTLAVREEDRIVFLLRHRHHDLDKPKPVLLDSHLAEPMRRALMGRSGTVVGPDYRNIQVLAAHEPVAIMNFGIVAKIDLSEIRAPFIRAGGALLGISILLIGLGTVIFFRISDPMIRRIMETEALRESRALLAQSQRAFKEKAVYLDNILRSSTDLSIIATNKEFRIQYYNPTAEGIFGYRAEEVLGRFVSEIHKEKGVEQERFDKGIDAVRAHGEHHYEVEETVDGEKRFVQSRVSPILDPEDNVVGYVLMSRDVTPSRMAEKALLEAKEGLTKAQEIAHLGNWDWNVETGDLSWSDEIYRIFGLKPQEFPATYEAFLQVVHPDDQKKVTAAVQPSLDDPETPYGLEHRIVRPDGAERIVQEKGEVVRNDAGKPIRMVGSVLDITELKQAEEKVRDLNANLERRVEERTRQLAEANEELEAFSYSVAHDLRAPLNNAEGFTQILVEDHRECLDGEGREYLGLLESSVLQMKKRIRDYLNLARSTRATMEHEPVDLSNIAKGVVGLIKVINPEQEEKSIEITPDLRTVGDPHLLTIVLENLFSNALKFTASSPNPTIVFGQKTKEDGSPEFFVRDNGVGFDPDQGGRLFQAFERFHDPVEYGGSGIGLATAKRIINRHGGEIRAESSPGEGATFFFTLGAGEKPQAYSSKKEAARL